MSSWSEIQRPCPELAQRVRVLFDAHRHKTLATIRGDGAPRISGIELGFVDGEVIIGMMAESMKVRDVAQDNRVAIHSNS
jgi:hypothetical protein